MALKREGKDLLLPEAKKRAVEESTAMYIPTREIHYTWAIPNFSKLSTCRRFNVTSPSFSEGVNDKFKWELVVYPNGMYGTSKGYLSVKLCFLPGEKSKAYAKCNCYIPNDKKTDFFTWSDKKFRTFSEYESLSCETTLTRARLKTFNLLPNNVLTIICDIVIAEDFITTMKKPVSDVCEEMTNRRLLQDINDLYESPKLCDVTFIVCDKEIQAHKVILAARSPVFAAMFNTDMKEKQQNQVDITDVNYDVLAEMMRYVYTGKTINLDKMADGLLAAADKYGLETLKDNCEQALRKSITAENAASLLALGDLHSAVLLKTEALDFICTHTKEVLKTTNYQSLRDTHPLLIDEVVDALANEIIVLKTSA